MSETWTPASSTSESWSSTTVGDVVFSPLVFSHASYASKFVFAFSNAASDSEGWHKSTSTSESWSAA